MTAATSTRLILAAYLLSAAWMTVGVTLRFIIVFGHGQTPDVLPFITATIAVVAILWLLVMRTPSPAVLVAMIAWNFVGAAARILFQLASPTHQIDFIPVVSLAVGVIGLTVLAAVSARPRQEA